MLSFSRSLCSIFFGLASAQLPLAHNREDQVNFRFGLFISRRSRANVCAEALSTQTSVPTQLTHLRMDRRTFRTQKNEARVIAKPKNKNIIAVNARRPRQRNPDINYLKARRGETSGGRVRFERFTKFAKADIQMALQKKREKSKRETRGSRIWPLPCLDKNRLASFRNSTFPRHICLLCECISRILTLD